MDRDRAGERMGGQADVDWALRGAGQRAMPFVTLLMSGSSSKVVFCLPVQPDGN